MKPGWLSPGTAIGGLDSSRVKYQLGCDSDAGATADASPAGDAESPDAAAATRHVPTASIASASATKSAQANRRPAGDAVVRRAMRRSSRMYQILVRVKRGRAVAHEAACKIVAVVPVVTVA